MSSNSRDRLQLSMQQFKGLEPGDFIEIMSGLLQPFKLDTPTDNQFSVHSIQLSSLRLIHIRSISGFSIRTEPNPHPYNLHLPLAQEFHDRRTGLRFSPGSGGFVPRQGAAVIMDFGHERHQADFLCMICESETLWSYTQEQDPDQTALPLPDHQDLVLASKPGHGLHRMAQFVVQGFLAEFQQWQSPLVMAELQDMMLALFLELLPRQPRALSPASTGPQIASKTYVNAARDYILAHLGEPLSIGHISMQVGVHPRTLHKAFRRHLDASPMAYIKAHRLKQVHQELLAADPGDTTITRCASRWGFNNPGHFAVDYRKAFGEPPSATLRRSAAA